MKIKAYVDVYPWTKPEDVYFLTSPGEKSTSAKRYKVTFEIPDPAVPDEIVEASVEEIR